MPNQPNFNDLLHAMMNQLNINDLLHAMMDILQMQTAQGPKDFEPGTRPRRSKFVETPLRGGHEIQMANAVTRHRDAIAKKTRLELFYETGSRRRTTAPWPPSARNS